MGGVGRPAAMFSAPIEQQALSGGGADGFGNQGSMKSENSLEGFALSGGDGDVFSPAARAPAIVPRMSHESGHEMPTRHPRSRSHGSTARMHEGKHSSMAPKSGGETEGRRGVGVGAVVRGLVQEPPKK